MTVLFSINLSSQKADPFKPDFSKPAEIEGMKLVWTEEFNIDSKPDPASWRYEKRGVANRSFSHTIFFLTWHWELPGAIRQKAGSRSLMRSTG